LTTECHVSLLLDDLLDDEEFSGDQDGDGFLSDLESDDGISELLDLMSLSVFHDEEGEVRKRKRA